MEVRFGDSSLATTTRVHSGSCLTCVTEPPAGKGLLDSAWGEKKNEVAAHVGINAERPKLIYINPMRGFVILPKNCTMQS